MGQHRTAWHLLAATFLDEYRPRDVQLETEVQLSKRPQHVDMLLLRKGKGSVDDARAFFRMWHLMGPVALVEYKSRRRPARSGVFHQLFGYAHQYARSRQPEQPASQLSLFLLIPTVTPTIVKDAARLGLELGRSEDAYIPVMGALFPTWVVVLNTLAEQEGEPLIGELGSRTVDSEDRASLQWLAHFYMANENRVQNLEGFEELKADFMKSESFREMVAAMSAEQIAQTLTPEQRYAVLLAMSDEELRELPDSFIEALPASIRAEIRRRLAH